VARRRKNKQAVSLFPFLSILACVIGTLTLMITAMALGQMDNDTVASAEKFQKVKDQLQKDVDLIRRLKAEIARIEAQADDVQKQLAEARLKLDRLEREKDELFRENEQDGQPPPIEIPTFDPAKSKKRLEELQSELARQDTAKKQFLAELKKRKKPAEEAEVVIQPGGSGVDLDPTFVECTSSGIVIYEGAQPQRVRRGDLATDEQYLGLLERIAAEPKARAIFLVRDDGLATYYAARDVANLRSARNGKLPVIGHGRIDLSLFEKN